MPTVKPAALIRPLLVTQSDTGGGAARAALRLHRALRLAGVNSTMLVRAAASGEAGVHGARNRAEAVLGQLRSLMGRALMRLQQPIDTCPRSGNFVPSRWATRIESFAPDVVNLHWLGGETMSIEDIGRIRRPTVWSLHDMWAFCGTEHYLADPERSRQAYATATRPVASRGLDLDRLVWSRKRRSWHMPLRVVAPSNWLARCASQSTLLHDIPVTVIPNVLDTDTYRPHDRLACRAALGLPDDRPLLLFGAVFGDTDPNKGFDLLLQALQHVAADPRGTRVECVIFGIAEPNARPPLPLRTHWLGRIDDDAKLACIYAAADVMVVPSRVENLPQTATEAQACGCPVAGFAVTGMPDAVADRVTGWLAPAYDPRGLAEGILWLIEDGERRHRLSLAARERATRLWSAASVVPRYLDEYAQAIEDARQHAPAAASSRTEA